MAALSVASESPTRTGGVTVSDVAIEYRTRSRRGSEVVTAVTGVSLNVAPGEFVALIGPSGCGKSTLLKAIAGLIPLKSGSVHHERGADARIGMMFQTDALLPWKTAIANVELAARLAGKEGPRAHETAIELLGEMGLAESAEKFPRQLSGGMRKRVALARTLAYDPEVFMLDEPFSALDAQTRISVGNFFLKTLEEQHKTVILVTHDIEEAVATADRAFVMSNRGPGRIAEEIDIPLPRPRDYHETRFLDGFNALQQRLWESLRTNSAGGL
jgi:NitT/TauT family transport system ATP-binding protein